MQPMGNPAYGGYGQAVPQYPPSGGQYPYQYLPGAAPYVPYAGAYPNAPAPYPGAAAPTPYGGATAPAPTPYAGAVAPGRATAPVPYPDAQPATAQPGQAPASKKTSTASSVPAPSRPKYHIREADKAKYANIYSLIAAVEAVEDEYCNGNISPDEHNRVLNDLKKQFNTVKSAMSLSVKDVTNFCEAARLPHGYAVAALFDADIEDDGTPTSNLKQALDLGTDFTTLSDFCALGSVRAEEAGQLVRTIKARLQALGVLNRNGEAKAITDKWVEKFDAMRAGEIVPDAVIEELKRDITVWKISALDSLGK